MNDKKKIIQQYLDFLSNKSFFQWSFWCTITTQKKLTVKSAHRIVNRFSAIFIKFLKGKFILDDKTCLMFYVVEPFEHKEGYHIHLLLHCPKNIKFPLLRSFWKQAIGNSLVKNSCKISSFHEEAHIYDYIASKVILKRVEHDFIYVGLF